MNLNTFFFFPEKINDHEYNSLNKYAKWIKLALTGMSRIIWLNIAKFGVYLHYRHCSNLFKEMRKESEFWQRCCRNSTKVWERKRKSRREKILNFGNVITEIPAARTSGPSVCCVLCARSVKCSKKKPIVAMPLPKMGGKK